MPINSCSTAPRITVAIPPSKDALPSRPPAITCMMRAGLWPVISEAAPMSMVAAMRPPRTMALRAWRFFCCMDVARVSAHAAYLKIHSETLLGDHFAQRLIRFVQPIVSIAARRQSLDHIACAPVCVHRALGIAGLRQCFCQGQHVWWIVGPQCRRTPRGRQACLGVAGS